MKVTDPSPGPVIHTGDDFLRFLPMRTPGGLFPDCLPQLVTAFWAGFAMRIVLAALSFSPHQPKPQKLETLFLKVHSRPKGDRLRRRSGPAGVERSDINTRLLFIEFKFPSSQLFL